MIPQIAIYLALITPTTIDTVPVYHTNHIVIAQEPTQEYEWDTVVLPKSWPLNTYYVELWDANNQPIAGHTATKLTSHTIDISDIDASLTPSLRVVTINPSTTWGHQKSIAWSSRFFSPCQCHYHYLCRYIRCSVRFIYWWHSNHLRPHQTPLLDE